VRESLTGVGFGIGPSDDIESLRFVDQGLNPEISSSEQKISEVPGVNRYG
jgi:hypothetical protein